jgi:hypothetical protein
MYPRFVSPRRFFLNVENRLEKYSGEKGSECGVEVLCIRILNFDVKVSPRKSERSHRSP